jgi:hypothetical protein
LECPVQTVNSVFVKQWMSRTNSVYIMVYLQDFSTYFPQSPIVQHHHTISDFWTFHALFHIHTFLMRLSQSRWFSSILSLTCLLKTSS